MKEKFIKALESNDLDEMRKIPKGDLHNHSTRGGNKRYIEEWAGVKDGVWERAHEEKFARGFEKYLADGIAPTPRLKAVFGKFKEWLTSIYQNITGSAIDIEIPDKVRQVFDSLLGEERKPTDTSGVIDFLNNKLDSSKKMNVAHPGIVDAQWMTKLKDAATTYKAYVNKYGEDSHCSNAKRNKRSSHSSIIFNPW